MGKVGLPTASLRTSSVSAPAGTTRALAWFSCTTRFTSVPNTKWFMTLRNCSGRARFGHMEEGVERGR